MVKTTPTATAGDQAAERLSLLAKALSDPTRPRMKMMVVGRPCCEGATCAPTVPADASTTGICVCEFQYERPRRRGDQGQVDLLYAEQEDGP
ncbi:MAG: hypothetical protein ACYC9Q_09650 [Bacillota bacterium]